MMFTTAGPTVFSGGHRSATACTVILLNEIAQILGIVLPDGKTHDQLCMFVAELVFQWIAQGFPACAARELRLQAAQKAILSWAFPEGLTTSRGNRAILSLYLSIAVARGLRALWIHQSRKRHLRVLMRALHPDVQGPLLGTDEFGQRWAARLQLVFRAIWSPETLPVTSACTYLV